MIAIEPLTPEGELARTAYCKFRRFIHPQYEPGPKHNNSFNKLGDLVSDSGIDMNTFMEVNFRAIIPYPYITALLSNKAVGRCMNTAIDIDHEAEVYNRLKFEIDYAKDRIEADFPVEWLFERGTPLSVVFRYYLSCKFNFPKIAKALKEPADVLLARDSVMRKVYMPLLEECNGTGGKRK